MCKLARRIIEDLMVERLEKNRLMAVSGMSIEELTDAFTKGYRLLSPEAFKNDVPDDLRIMPKNGGDEDAIEFSKEDAIKMLKSKMDGHTDTSYEWAETVRMAIKALEQEPKTGHWMIDETSPRSSISRSTPYGHTSGRASRTKDSSALPDTPQGSRSGT